MNDVGPYKKVEDAYKAYIDTLNASDEESIAITELVRALTAVNESAVLAAFDMDDSEPDAATLAYIEEVCELGRARDRFVDSLAQHIVTLEDGVGDPEVCEAHALLCARGVITAEQSINTDDDGSTT